MEKLTRKEIRLLLHFQWIRGIHYEDAAKAIREAYGTKTDRKTAWRWYERFKEEGRQLEDKKRSGRPREIDREAVIHAIEEAPTMTTRMLAEDFDCVHGTIENILHEAGLRWRKTRWIPYELTNAQKQRRVEVAEQLLNRHNQEPITPYMVTQDETYVSFRNPKPQNAWVSPGQRVPSTPVPDFRNKKILLSVFWGPRGVIYWKLMEKTMDSRRYCRQLGRVAEVLEESGREDPVLYHHDNASSHTANVTKKKLRDLHWEVLPHPPYSPDLAPSDFHLFRSLKGWLKGRQFNSVDETRAAIQEFFDSKDVDFYRRGFDNLVDRWQQVIVFDGDYCD